MEPGTSLLKMHGVYVLEETNEEDAVDTFKKIWYPNFWGNQVYLWRMQSLQQKAMEESISD